MKRRGLRWAMVQLSVAGSLGLALTLILISGGNEVSLAQVSLSPSCSLIDPLTGLCQTITSIVSPTPPPTTLPPTTTTTLPAITTTTTSSPVSTTGQSSGPTGGTSSGSKGAGSSLPGGKAPFGSTAYAPGGLFFGAYAGNYGGGTTFFAPGGQTVSSSQLYYQSAFGTPVSKAVAAAAVGPSISSAPVASAITQLPRTVVLLFPAVVLLMLLVTSLVLEVNEGGVRPEPGLLRSDI
jgi:hypothetical protein